MIRQVEIRVKAGSPDDTYLRGALESSDQATVRIVLPRTNLFISGRLTFIKENGPNNIYLVTREDS